MSMWSYYGSKTNIVHLYPPPKYGKIIEPFAGTARYALKYFDRDVLLVDKYDVIIKIWKWLQQCSPGDVLRLPRRIKPKESLENYSFDCEEAKKLMGFLVSYGVESPRINATDKHLHRPNFVNYSLMRIANNLFKIKHWKFIHGSYENLPNDLATWFIDPPYQFGGHSYVHSSKDIDFTALAHWSAGRNGQIIVCESAKADWMPFIPIAEHKGRTGMQKEVFWTNERTSYGVKQETLFTETLS
jgi:hypothetical protein